MDRQQRLTANGVLSLDINGEVVVLSTDDLLVETAQVIYAMGNDKISGILTAHKEENKSEVLANDIVLDTTAGYVKEWSINGEKVTMTVERQ